MLEKVRVGLIGCGNISGIYLKNCTRFDILDVTACADLDMTRAQAKANEYGIPRALTVTDLLADPSIEMVINLTTPDAHAEIALAAIKAGKSVYNEKPLTMRRQDAQALLTAAAAKGLRVGGAPDTFLGGGLQTCRKLIDDGAIGKPVSAAASMVCHGHESWHPDPEFYYKAGGGPMFDMGPYYLTALVTLIGPVRRVAGATQITFPERLITSQPKAGTKIVVDVPTHVTGLLEFADGAMGTIVTSFDVWASELPLIEIHGTLGTLSVPDPNSFGGTVRLRRASDRAWETVSLTHGYTENSRGLGVADMAYALRTGVPHRANGELAYHVLDIMHAIHDSAEHGRYMVLESTCPRPHPLPAGASHEQPP
jgi:predicted dehydrogenase